MTNQEMIQAQYGMDNIGYPTTGKQQVAAKPVNGSVGIGLQPAGYKGQLLDGLFRYFVGKAVGVKVNEHE